MNEIGARHRAEYEAEPDIVVSAPGTANLMGAHTEHSGGYVLQVAVNKRMYVSVSRRTDNSLRFFAADLGERKRTTVATLKYKREDRWANYLKGVLHQLHAAGYRFKGMNICVSGEITPGVGLASSAGIVTAMAAAANELFELHIPPSRVADIARRAEAVFMKQDAGMALPVSAMFAKRNQALLYDARKGSHMQVPLDLEDAVLLVTDSRVPMSGTAADFQQRVEDCQECLRMLQGRHAGSSLRDYSRDDLREPLSQIPELKRRRCLHVLGENERVLESLELIRRKDFVGLGKIMMRSHASLRDMYETSCPEIDWLVKRSGETEGVYGARLIGPGFGGCTMTLVKRSQLSAYHARMEEYERIFGFTPETFVVEVSGGVTREG